MRFRFILLPFFIVKLLLVNIPFLLNIIFFLIRQYKTSLFIIFLFLLYSFFLLGSFQKTLSVSETLPKKNVVSSSLYKTETYQKPLEINKIKTGLEKIALLSPTSRNISLNLALIFFYQGNFEKFSKYWHQAKETDPNNSVFLNPPRKIDSWQEKN